MSFLALEGNRSHLKERKQTKMFTTKTMFSEKRLLVTSLCRRQPGDTDWQLLPLPAAQISPPQPKQPPAEVMPVGTL